MHWPVSGWWQIEIVIPFLCPWDQLQDPVCPSNWLNIVVLRVVLRNLVKSTINPQLGMVSTIHFWLTMQWFCVYIYMILHIYNMQYWIYHMNSIDFSQISPASQWCMAQGEHHGQGWSQRFSDHESCWFDRFCVPKHHHCHCIHWHWFLRSLEDLLQTSQRRFDLDIPWSGIADSWGKADMHIFRGLGASFFPKSSAATSSTSLHTNWGVSSPTETEGYVIFGISALCKRREALPTSWCAGASLEFCPC